MNNECKKEPTDEQSKSWFILEWIDVRSQISDDTIGFSSKVFMRARNEMTNESYELKCNWINDIINYFINSPYKNNS